MRSKEAEIEAASDVQDRMVLEEIDRARVTANHEETARSGNGPEGAWRATRQESAAPLAHHTAPPRVRQIRRLVRLRPYAHW